MELTENDYKKHFIDHQIKVARANENIVPPKQMKKIISDVFEDLSNMIKYTIGPAGGNTLVTEPYASTPIYPTKDGFTVMNNHIYDNPTYESIYRIVRDISGRMNQELGDATTSSVVIAADFYKRITKYLNKHKEITPYGIKNILDVVYEHLSKYLKKKTVVDIKDLSKQIKIEIYRKIATIAANNDSTIGDIIAEAYEKAHSDEPFIDIQQSLNAETTIETDVGFELPYGYNLPYMANMSDGITAEYDHPMFLLVSGPLLDKSLQFLKTWINWVAEDPQNPRPLVIFAEEFSKDILDYLTLCRTGITRVINGQRVLVKLPVLAICFNMSSEYGAWRVDDLEAILGCKALKTNNGNLIVTPSNATEFFMMLGRADHVISKFGFTRIRGGAGDMALRNGRIAEIKKMMEKNKDYEQHGITAKGRFELMRHRISMLEGEMQIIKVGGDSYKEKTNRRLIFDDAVCAVKACIKNGVSLGGQVSVPFVINTYKEFMINDIVSDLTDTKTVKNIGINISDSKLETIINQILNIINLSSQSAFRAVFDNATNNKRWINKIFKVINNSDSPVTFNLISNKFESLKGTDKMKGFPDLIVPGNTDSECIKSAFSIINLFLTSNQLISLMVKM